MSQSFFAVVSLRRRPPGAVQPTVHDGVRMTRDGTAAVIEHDCEPVVAVRLELGTLATTLSDREILERYEHKLGALGAALVATPQLRWDDAGLCWVPRGHAIRLTVEPAIDEPTVMIDEIELTVAELTSMLSSHGAQICLVFLDE